MPSGTVGTESAAKAVLYWRDSSLSTPCPGGRVSPRVSRKSVEAEGSHVLEPASNPNPTTNPHNTHSCQENCDKKSSQPCHGNPGDDVRREGGVKRNTFPCSNV
jgi:hypothetical protein